MMKTTVLVDIICVNSIAKMARLCKTVSQDQLAKSKTRLPDARSSNANSFDKQDKRPMYNAPTIMITQENLERSAIVILLEIIQLLSHSFNTNLQLPGVPLVQKLNTWESSTVVSCLLKYNSKIVASLNRQDSFFFLSISYYFFTVIIKQHNHAVNPRSEQGSNP